MEPARFAIRPRVEHLARFVNHLTGVSLNVLVLKCRLRQPRLPPPERALASEQALANQGADRLRQHVFDKFLVVSAKDVFDVFWIHKHIGIEIAQAKLDDIAMSTNRLGEEAERVS